MLVLFTRCKIFISISYTKNELHQNNIKRQNKDIEEMEKAKDT